MIKHQPICSPKISLLVVYEPHKPAFSSFRLKTKSRMGGYAICYTRCARRSTLYALRYTLYAIRFTLHTIRYTPHVIYAVRYTLYVIRCKQPLGQIVPKTNKSFQKRFLGQIIPNQPLGQIVPQTACGTNCSNNSFPNMPIKISPPSPLKKKGPGVLPAKRLNPPSSRLRDVSGV